MTYLILLLFNWHTSSKQLQCFNGTSLENQLHTIISYGVITNTPSTLPLFKLKVRATTNDFVTPKLSRNTFFNTFYWFLTCNRKTMLNLNLRLLSYTMLWMCSLSLILVSFHFILDFNPLFHSQFQTVSF